MFAVGTGEVLDGVVTVVTSAVGVMVAPGVCVAGGSVPSCFEVHPEQRTNSTQMIAINVPITIFWFMIKDWYRNIKSCLNGLPGSISGD